MYQTFFCHVVSAYFSAIAISNIPLTFSFTMLLLLGNLKYLSASSGALVTTYLLENALILL